MKEKVMVGMSGGVDSSVAAYLLTEQGYEVVGVTACMEHSGNAERAVEDAAKVAGHLGIAHEVADVSEQFRHKVKDYFIEEYLHGRTPNPCTVCNRQLKWGVLWDYGRERGAQYLATGHYARILRLKNGRFTVVNAASSEKDQTYALYALTQGQLSVTKMPVGDYTKGEIREIAAHVGLPVAAKPDSQDICFIPDGDYAAFLEREAKERVPGVGNYVNRDGVVLGTHKGITHYTVGQRKGLGIALGHPVFVTQIRPETNEVVLGEEEELFRTDFVCGQVNLMAVESIREPVEVTAKVRYAHKGEKCVIHTLADGRIAGRFLNPVRAITPGQAVVFYAQDKESLCPAAQNYVFGGGILL